MGRQNRKLGDHDGGAGATLEATFVKRRVEKDGGAWAVSEIDDPRGTIVGPMLDPKPGMRIRIHDVTKKTHPTFGLQHVYKHYEWLGWQDLRGMARHLADTCAGIGMKTAEKIVAEYGDKALEILRDTPADVAAKIGLRVEIACAAAEILAKDRESEGLRVLLRGAGIGMGRVSKLIALYGADGLAQRLQENPWILADEVDGIGFATADQLAMRTKHPMDSPLRGRSALRHFTSELSVAAGHVWHPAPDVVAVAEKAGVPRSVMDAALVEAAAQKGGMVVTFQDPTQATPIVALRALTSAEAMIATRLGSDHVQTPPLTKWDEVAAEDEELDDSQKAAVERVRASRVSVVTGGPGTGKSRCLFTIYRALRENRIMVLAPTGKAAVRVAEISKAKGYPIPAMTIHRAILPCERDGEMLDADVVLVDETSMVDSALMARLLAVIRDDASIHFFGDADQLPPVSPGAPFRDMIASGKVAVSRLTTTHRARPTSWLAENARGVNEGRFPYFGGSLDEVDDFFLFESEDEEVSAQLIAEIVSKRLPGRFQIERPDETKRAIDPVADIQVVAPMKRGACGTEALNDRLRALLNPPLNGDRGLFRGQIRLKDKVIQVKNDYGLGVMNGEVGVVVDLARRQDVVEGERAQRWDEWMESGKNVPVDDLYECSCNAPASACCCGPRFRTREDWLAVDFGAGAVIYTKENSDHLWPAYALTIHKMQGSETPIVVIPVVRSHYIMLTRKLIYTAITRAKQRVVLVGMVEMLKKAVKTVADSDRRTFLRGWLENGLPTWVTMTGEASSTLRDEGDARR